MVVIYLLYENPLGFKELELEDDATFRDLEGLVEDADGILMYRSHRHRIRSSIRNMRKRGEIDEIEYKKLLEGL